MKRNFVGYYQLLYSAVFLYLISVTRAGHAPPPPPTTTSTTTTTTTPSPFADRKRVRFDSLNNKVFSEVITAILLILGKYFWDLLDLPDLKFFCIFCIYYIELFQWEKILFCPNAYFCLKMIFRQCYFLFFPDFVSGFWKVQKILHFFLNIP